VQGSAEAPTAVECLPAAQGVHACASAVCLYLPASHAAQTGPAEAWPALHTQSAMDALLGGECELLWHCTHCVPSSAEYEPGAHSVQGSAEAPTALECLPAAQGVHG